MNKRLFVAGMALLLTFGMVGCEKNTGTTNCETLAQQDAKLMPWTATQQGVYTKHSSGIYYQIVNAGSGAVPYSNASVRVSYVGRLLDGTQFDASSSARFTLNQVISAWQVMLPLIREGGTIRFASPSTLAYGCAGSGSSIPPNSPLFFEVNLIEVN